MIWIDLSLFDPFTSLILSGIWIILLGTVFITPFILFFLYINGKKKEGGKDE